VATEEPERLVRLVLTGAVAGSTTAVDLLTKAWAWDTLRTQGARGVIAGRLQFEFSFNTGSAFGMLRDASWGHAFFLTISVLLILVLVSLAWRLPTRTATPFWGIGLALGGVLGNLHDRLFRELLIVGEGMRPGVVDFIVVFYAKHKRWPAFNVADITILVGVVLVFAFFYRLGKDED
jgi:signal peptidase II